MEGHVSHYQFHENSEPFLDDGDTGWAGISFISFAFLPLSFPGYFAQAQVFSCPITGHQEFLPVEKRSELNITFVPVGYGLPNSF